MTQVLTIVYLMYMFLALYFLSLVFLLFVQNKKEMFSVPVSKRKYTVSVLVPAYNEENSIESIVKTILDSDYAGIVEVIIINDGSRDNTLKIAKKLAERYSKIRILNKKNSGKADSLNQALKIAKGEIIAVVDADSYPDSHAIRTMIGFFDEPKVGAVTTRILLKQRNNFLRKM